ncbi:MAG TPA: lipopolysaccharide transport periplasmic protein LptA [Burkholderiales bacterium]|nr:lipopolysaccharide transport periplasmic protein LptA [Burkholderiales bacterium]
MRQRHAILLAAAIAAMSAFSATAEKADREKPTQIEANRMTSDEARRVSIFVGNVVLTKGTLKLQAERLEVRQDADGFQHATATGSPVRFRQKSDPRGGLEGVWIDAEAGRIEIDEKAERVEMRESARVTRDKDEVRGSYILYDQRSEFFSVTSTKDAPDARVRAVIQPKKPDAEAPAPSKPGAQK